MSTHRTPAHAWLAVTIALISMGCASSGTPQPTGGLGGSSGASGVGGTGGAGMGGLGGSAGFGGAGVGGSGGDASSSGEGGSAGTAATNRVSPDQVCQRLAEIQCAAESRCCNDAARKYVSGDACVDGQRTICNDVFKVAIVGTDSRTGYSVDLAQQALDTFESKVAQCALDAQSWGASADGFLTMFAGTRGSGQSCQPTSETDFAAGLSCTTGLTCAPSMKIVNVPTGWACRPRAVEGGKCFADINCVDGMRCIEINTLSTCAPTLALTMSCSRPTECQSLVCRQGLCADVTQDNVYCLGG